MRVTDSRSQTEMDEEVRVPLENVWNKRGRDALWKQHHGKRTGKSRGKRALSPKGFYPRGNLSRRGEKIFPLRWLGTLIYLFRTLFISIFLFSVVLKETNKRVNEMAAGRVHPSWSWGRRTKKGDAWRTELSRERRIQMDPDKKKRKNIMWIKPNCLFLSERGYAGKIWCTCSEVCVFSPLGEWKNWGLFINYFFPFWRGTLGNKEA